jgi:hypothetical protein
MVYKEQPVLKPEPRFFRLVLIQPFYETFRILRYVVVRKILLYPRSFKVEPVSVYGEVPFLVFLIPVSLYILVLCEKPLIAF